MTTCARLAQNVRPLGGLVGRGAALVALGLLPLVAGCTKAQQQGTGSSYLILNSIEGDSGAKPDTFGVPLASDVIDKGGVVNDLGQVVMHLGLKDPLVRFADVTDEARTSSPCRAITSSSCARRPQHAGRGRPPFDGAMTLTVGSGNATRSFEVVRVQAGSRRR